MQIESIFSGVRLSDVQRLRQYANDLRGPQSWCTYMWYDFKSFDIQAAQNNWYELEREYLLRMKESIIF